MHNRPAYVNLMGTTWYRARKLLEPMGLTMIDLAAKIDQFEQMNATGGAMLLENKTFLLTDTQE